MDDSNIDDLARALSIPSRRTMLSAIVTALATLCGRNSAEEALARRKKRRTKQADKSERRDSGRVRANNKRKKKKKTRRGVVTAPPSSPPASPPLPSSPLPPPLPGCANCDDGIACTIDRCDASTGTCLHTPDDSRCGQNWVCDIQHGCICPAPHTACGQDCVDTQNDRTHCGTCANACPIQAPQTCGTTGQCVRGFCQQYGPETECRVARCVWVPPFDLQLEVGSCMGGHCQLITLDCPFGCDAATASCRRPCSQDSECGSDSWCNGGRCQFTQGNGTACSTSTPQQCISGFCVDGVCCDSACDAPVPANTTRSCTTGTCALTCNVGFDNCDGNMANGCEADLTSDQYCGQCGNNCAMQTCGSGLHGECQLNTVSNTYRCECVG